MGQRASRHDGEFIEAFHRAQQHPLYDPNLIQAMATAPYASSVGLGVLNKEPMIEELFRALHDHPQTAQETGEGKCWNTDFDDEDGIEGLSRLTWAYNDRSIDYLPLRKLLHLLKRDDLARIIVGLRSHKDYL